MFRPAPAATHASQSSIDSAARGFRTSADLEKPILENVGNEGEFLDDAGSVDGSYKGQRRGERRGDWPHGGRACDHEPSGRGSSLSVPD